MANLLFLALVYLHVYRTIISVLLQLHIKLCLPKFVDPYETLGFLEKTKEKVII